MELTNEKIRVTHDMMVKKGMTRGAQYGIPVDPKEPPKGLRWKDIIEMKDEDFNSIEEYFILTTPK